MPAQPQDEPAVDTAAQAANAFLAVDLDALGKLLDERSTFRSPVTEYVGRERILELLGPIGHVLAEPRLTGTLTAEREFAATFTAQVASRQADGVVHVIAGDERVRSITLMLRPLKTLLAAVEEMRKLMEPAPERA